MRPLISCICVTRGKPDLLKRAIACFEAQSYTRKELIVLYEQDDHATKTLLHTSPYNDEVKIIEVPAHPRRRLGELRNIAIEAATGELICQWDDDDWYHMHRLEYQQQVLHMSGYEACVMTQWLILDSTTGNIYLSNKRRWEGSILCRKDILKLKLYDDVSRGEDTAVVDYLYENGFVYEITDRHDIYIYIYHGGNTWHAGHWENIFYHGRRLGNAEDIGLKALLNNELDVAQTEDMMDQLLNVKE